jgi:opacity protein-like surface antigen
MNRRIILAALLAATSLTSPALAADLYPKAPPIAAPVLYTDWTGFYVGIAGGYGWGRQSFDRSITRFDDVFGTGIDRVYSDLNTILQPNFTISPIDSIRQKGFIAGGFFGAQKQMGNWVFGLEGDVDVTGIKGSVDIGSSTRETVTRINLVNPTIGPLSGTGTIGPLTGTGDVTIPSTPVTGSVNIGGIIATGTASVVGVTGTIVPSSTSIGPFTIVTPDPLPNIPIPQISVPINGNVNVPGQNAPVTTSTNAGTAPLVNGATIGQTVPLTVTIPQTAVSVNVPAVQLGTLVPVAETRTALVSRTFSTETKIDELGSLRGKVGFVPARDWMIYGTGGLAWAHTTSSLTVSQNVQLLGEGGVPIGAPRFDSFTSTTGATLLGWAAGAGVDWKLTPNVILGALYLHYDFPKNTVAFTDNNGISLGLGTSRQSIDAVKARLSWLIN